MKKRRHKEVRVWLKSKRSGLAAALLALMHSCPLAAVDFNGEILPLLKDRCLSCHSTEKQKGDLDLERFGSLEDIKRAPTIWQNVLEQLDNGEMPPKDKPQLTPEQKLALTSWLRTTLDEIALANAGDPGPVILRRLSNMEYTYTLRDLTKVPSLDPAREFPVDGAAGEGFTNVGAALVMSPALLTKYLDAAKEVAAHAVLLPDGITFSSSTSQSDWTEERLAAIRAFYAKFTVNGGGGAVDLQGIKFDTKDGGVLPLEKYLAATISQRDAIQHGKSLSDVARDAGLNAKYLNTLWTALNNAQPSLLLDQLRAEWRHAKPDDAARLAKDISQWQQALWRFTTVGHIGKRDGPKAWMVPVSPLAESREVRVKLTAPATGNEVKLYLTTTNAGDGNAHDAAVWDNARLVAPGRPDLPLRDVRAAVQTLTKLRSSLFDDAAKYLSAASEVSTALTAHELSALATKHGLDAAALTAWLNCLGLGSGATTLEGHMTAKSETSQNYDFIKGWTGADALSVVANASDAMVRIPGNMKPHSVAVHPAPTQRALVSWRSPLDATLTLDGMVQHAHTDCGNGVAWRVELRRGHSRQPLATGIAKDATEMKFGPFANLKMQPGDAISVVISPQNGDHTCDLTAIDINLSDGTNVWNLAKDVSPNLLAGNPHADSLGHANVWHFHSEPDKDGTAAPLLPQGSLLEKWVASHDPNEKQALAVALQKLLLEPAPSPSDLPDGKLRQLLTSMNGPLLGGVVRGGKFIAATDSTAGEWGIDPTLFVKGTNQISVQAPSLIEVRLPVDLAEGCEFVATASLEKATGAEGSVQMQALTIKPVALNGLAAGSVQPTGGKRTWSDGDLSVATDCPLLITTGSSTQKRLEAELDAFRQLFPAALCYSKLVPVDEVVTLTLNYREDDHLRRLMLDDAQSAQLDRLWEELHYVSQDALKLVDAFEQLWQFATQDADPSAFTPMREPIKRRAEAFRQKLLATEPAHLTAVLSFAEQAYRRPLLPAEQKELGNLYGKLRNETIAHADAIRLLIARVLLSPAFLYRGEAPPLGATAGRISNPELATRLSYFLWSSAPDTELRALAAAGTLQDPNVLAAQAQRLCKHENIRRLATEFGCQWLHVRDVGTLNEKSERHFPSFLSVRESMQEEAVRFFVDLWQEDRSVLSLLDADHSFINGSLAKHYGIPTKGDDWQRVEGLRAHGRGGILGFASTLAKQSGASRTSPILRGNWLSEVLLGDKLPRPPKGVPLLPEEAPQGFTERQLIERHSNDDKCAGCHKRIDPYGFALEGFDAIGRARTRDAAGLPINTDARLLDGTTIAGFEGLRAYLTGKRSDDFLRQFCRKLLGYALGRSIQLSDKPLIDTMLVQLKANQFKVSSAIDLIVRSPQFREVRGRDYEVN
jgi:hypothetical protein